MPNSPWKGLQPSVDLEHSTALRVDEKHPWDLFWAVGQRDLPQLVCRLPEGAELPPQQNIPRVRAIEIRLTHIPPWNCCIIELQDRTFEDIFQALCRALVEAIREVESIRGVMPVLLRHLARWQRMLSKSTPPHVLSLQDQIGLVGELLFLQDNILPSLPAHDAISCWVAPQKHPQDFMAPDSKAVEVKCRQATAPEMVHISSQWQLHQESLPLYLVVFTLGTSQNPQGFSLHSLVHALRDRFDGDPSAQDEFEIALFDRGYMDNQGIYDSRWWTTASVRAYSIRGEFPRINPDDLPAGIVEAGYTISLPACVSWTVDIDEIIIRH